VLLVTLLVVLLVAWLLFDQRRRVVGGSIYTGTYTAPPRTTIQTPFGTYASGPYGTNVVIPSSVLDALGGALSMPQPTVDPTATYTPDSLFVISPAEQAATAGLLPADAVPVQMDPSIDPSAGADPYISGAYDPTLGQGTVIGAFAANE
jgi:hypothetical protein